MQKKKQNIMHKIPFRLNSIFPAFQFKTFWDIFRQIKSALKMFQFSNEMETIVLV